MAGGTGMVGDSFYDGASGTNHGPGSPQAGQRSDVAARVERDTGRARLWLAVVLLAVFLVALGLFLLL